MDDRTRLLAAVGGTIGLFLCVQIGALALLDPYVAADAQPVEDPSNATNVAYFFGVILAATVAMLAAIKFGLEQLIRGFVLLSCGWISWLVLDTIVASLDLEAGGGTVGTAVETGAAILPFAIAAALVAALFVYPEWYVIDAAGVLLGAGAAGLFGLAFTPRLTIVFLVVLAVYDAISVYGTEHMLALAEGVTDLNVPVLLVVPTTRSFSLFTDEGPSSLERDDSEDEADASQSEIQGKDGEKPVQDERKQVESEEPGRNEAREPDATDDSDDGVRNAIYIGLGDAVMPTILAVSAAYFLRDAAPLFDVPLIAINLPALTALIGTLLGLVALLWMVLKGRAHAGLPMLNGGAIGGYLVGAVASGIGVAEALGLPV